jgi:large subunit ribosomal protein L25
MSNTKLAATTGRPTGSAASRRLRTEGHIPAVLYGGGMTPISLTVERRDLRIALSGPGGSNTLLSLEVDGASYPAVVKEIQRHPVKRTVSHIDFMSVNMDSEITVSVPVRLEGESKAAAAVDGLVDASADSIEVTCTPGNIPNEIVIDISSLQPGDVIRLADVKLPKGVTANGDPEMAIVSVIHSAPEAAAEGEAADSAE